MKIIIDLKCTNKECSKYNKVEEVYGVLEDIIDCPKCEAIRERVYVKTPSFTLKGEGFYKSGTF